MTSLFPQGLWTSPLILFFGMGMLNPSYGRPSLKVVPVVYRWLRRYSSSLDGCMHRPFVSCPFCSLATWMHGLKSVLDIVVYIRCGVYIYYPKQTVTTHWQQYLKVSLTIVCRIDFLIVIGQTASLPPKTISLRSSLQSSGKRNYSCPGETVSYSCDTFGNQLLWKANGYPIGTFKANASAGEGFICRGEECYGYSCYIFSGVLENIHPHGNYNYTSCHSTMTVTPGKFNASRVDNCSEYPSFIVTCAAGFQNTMERTLPFTIAGIYEYCVHVANEACQGLVKIYSAGLPDSDPVTGSCTYNRSTRILEVDIWIPTVTNTDLDYLVIELFDLSQLMNLNLVKVPAVGSSNITTSFPHITYESPSQLHINVTAFDKCGQSSPHPSTVQCTGILKIISVAYKLYDFILSNHTRWLMCCMYYSVSLQRKNISLRWMVFVSINFGLWCCVKIHPPS